jgi:membrane protein DedA with SNARE-associated domain
LNVYVREWRAATDEPSVLSAALAGSLVALGHMHWLATAATAIAVSVFGDAMLFGVGRAVGDQFLRLYGRRLGYNVFSHFRVPRF